MQHDKSIGEIHLYLSDTYVYYHVHLSNSFGDLNVVILSDEVGGKSHRPLKRVCKWRKNIPSFRVRCFIKSSKKGNSHEVMLRETTTNS
jgi:hypothetical protein